jgi:hypothetical protein
MKFYRYIIYILYKMFLDQKGSVPVTKTLVVLNFIHSIQLITLYIVLIKIFPQINIFGKINKNYFGLFFVLLFVIHYLFIYNKDKWEAYLEEFSDEPPSKAKLRTVLVYMYIGSSIILPVFITIFLSRL